MFLSKWKIESRLVKKPKNEPYDLSDFTVTPLNNPKKVAEISETAKEFVTYTAVTAVGAIAIVTILKTACSITILVVKAKLK